MKYAPILAVVVALAIWVGAWFTFYELPPEPVSDPEPVLMDVPDFSQIPAGPERKKAFVSYFLPAIEHENKRILEVRDRLVAAKEIGDYDGWVSELAEQYRIESFDDSEIAWRRLLSRVDIVPASLALAQAANESAWGTSRFAKQGNNYYGQWCFKAGCGLVPARRAPGASHEVAVFSSPQASLSAYMRNLNSHPVYSELRNIRARQRGRAETISGGELAEGLTAYSERGLEYVKELQAMIRHNHWAQYDDNKYP